MSQTLQEEIVDEVIDPREPDCVVIDGVCHRPSCTELFAKEA